MSKQIKEFFSKIRKNYDIAKKLGATFTSGSRILPSQTTKNDADYQLRLDQKQPQGTHAKLATARFDTLAEDQDAETERVLNELQEQARKNL
ncbi:conserved hypothetical protein [Histoplasma capsulatum H143]|uniref:Uncharacterized protein n=1 Tax=Ajellomyces capsulatus (strain H143) TaxID=544712 RepID=C6H796_AJECH|nr:conserved hypothetical protein [Histoplasma capsulatum H143]